MVNAALAALRSLLTGLRGGAQQLTGYEAGSLRLCVDELATLLRINGDSVTPLPYHWRVKDRGDKVLLFSPDRQTIVTLHCTPSDHRWLQNAYRDLRRGGFIRRNP